MYVWQITCVLAIRLLDHLLILYKVPLLIHYYFIPYYKCYILYFRQTINDIQNRHEMFLSLEKSITELHDMFLDIAQLIESQGEMVNRIGKYLTKIYELLIKLRCLKASLGYNSVGRARISIINVT